MSVLSGALHQTQHTHICLCKIAEFWCGASSSTNKYQHTISCAALWQLSFTPKYKVTLGHLKVFIGHLRVTTGCPISKFPLCFCHFLGFWSTYRGTSDLYSTALEICCMIATRIFKFDLEIAEIIEVKVGTCKTKIIFFDSVIAKC